MNDKNIESYSKIHQGEVEYRLSSEYRSRWIAWLMPLASTVTLAGSMMVPESIWPELSIIRTLLISGALIPSIMGKIAQNQIYLDGRINSDTRNVYNQGRNNRLFEISKHIPEKRNTIETSPMIPGDKYLHDMAKGFDTHLGIMSPTGTGKTTTLEYFLSLYTAEHKTTVIAIEPKDNPWRSLPPENVFRISSKVTLEDLGKIMRITDFLLSECDKRKEDYFDKGIISDNKIILILEEFLTVIKTVKVSHGTKAANKLNANLKALQNIGRALGIHVILISQSPVADDLGLSGGERSNLRLMLLGSANGGYEAIERSINNSQLVPNGNKRMELELKFQDAKKQCPTLQPIIMCNGNGDWDITIVPNIQNTVKILSMSLTVAFPEFYKNPGIVEEIVSEPDQHVTADIRYQNVDMEKSVTVDIKPDETIGNINPEIIDLFF